MTGMRTTRQCIDIKQVKQRKKQAEQRILDEIHSFTNDTGVNIVDIGVDAMEALDEYGRPLVSCIGRVNLEVQI